MYKLIINAAIPCVLVHEVPIHILPKKRTVEKSLWHRFTIIIYRELFDCKSQSEPMEAVPVGTVTTEAPHLRDQEVLPGDAVRLVVEGGRTVLQIVKEM